MVLHATTIAGQALDLSGWDGVERGEGALARLLLRLLDVVSHPSVGPVPLAVRVEVARFGHGAHASLRGHPHPDSSAGTHEQLLALDGLGARSAAALAVKQAAVPPEHELSAIEIARKALEHGGGARPGLQHEPAQWESDERKNRRSTVLRVRQVRQLELAGVERVEQQGVGRHLPAPRLSS